MAADSRKMLVSGRDAQSLNSLIISLRAIENELRDEWEGTKKTASNGDCPRDIELYWRRVLSVRHALCLVQAGKIPSKSFWRPSNARARLLLFRGKQSEAVPLRIEDNNASEAEDFKPSSEGLNSAFSLIETVREAEALIQLFKARQGDSQSLDLIRSKYKLPRLKGRRRGRPKTDFPAICGVPEFQRVVWDFFEHRPEAMSLTAQSKEILARLSKLEVFHKCLPSLTDVCNAIKHFDVEIFQRMKK